MIDLSNVEKQIKSDEAAVPNLRQNIGEENFMGWKVFSKNLF